jgi:cellulose synthase operon protein C
MKTQLTTFVLFMVLPMSHSFAKNVKKKANKKTVGYYLSQVQQQSRGGKISSQQKNAMQLPTAKKDLGFSPKTESDMNNIKPPRANEILQSAASGDFADYERILSKQIDELYKLTQKFKSSDNRGELWLRLAELYVEKAVLIDTRKQDEFDKRVKLFNQGKTRNRPILDAREARELNRKAIQLYDWFLKDFPRDAKVSQALFFLGFNNFELNQYEKGAEYYEKLIKKFPKSPFVGEAQFSLAEYYFEKEKWVLAYNRYAPLVQNKRHRLHNYSVYKGAWCLYRIGKYDQALKYLESIIRTGQAAEGEALATKRVVNKERLENEALRDIVVFFAAEKRANEAPEYFQRISGKENVNSYIEKLAYYYTDKGNLDAARFCFKYLIEKNPNSPLAFEYQYQIVQNYFYAKNTTRFKDELYGWVKDYGNNGSWMQANRGNSELIAKSQSLRETTLRNYILQQHQTAQNSRATFSQNSAKEGYQLYLDQFPKSTQIADMHFYYGELLYDMRRYDEATEQYRWVVENGSQSKFYSKAGANIIHAAEKSLPSDQEFQKRVGSSTEPIALDPRAESFIKAADWYLGKFPQGEKAAELKFRVGRLYYQHNQFDKANEVFKEVVKKYQKTKYSEYAANLILDIFNLKKDYIGMEKTGQELLQVPEISQSKAGGEIRDILEKASFKNAQNLEAEKKYAESAKQFEIFAKENPKSDLALNARFNAAINYDRENQSLKAIPLFIAVADSNSPSAAKLKPTANRLLAKIYQNASLFEDAVKYYREAIKEAPQDPLIPNYYFNIAVMCENMGRTSEAITAYKKYIELSPKKSEVKDAYFTVADLSKKLNRKSSAIENYEDYLNRGGSNTQKIAESFFSLSQLYKNSKPTESEKYVRRLQSLYKKSQDPTATKYAAQFKIEEAEKTAREFKSVNLPVDPNKQKKAVEKKIELLNQLTKELTRVVQMNSSEQIVSALELLGEANLHMYSAIMRAPLPKGLTEQETEMYKNGIKKIADPFQQKARESYKLAVSRAQELEVYTEAYSKAYNFMNSIESQNYYLNSETIFESKLVKWSVQ